MANPDWDQAGDVPASKARMKTIILNGDSPTEGDMDVGEIWWKLGTDQLLLKRAADTVALLTEADIAQGVMEPLTSAPGTPVDGQMYLADYNNWNPLSLNMQFPKSYPVVWDEDNSKYRNADPFGPSYESITLYLSPTGDDDNNDGLTVGTPWFSLHKAFEVLDRIRINNGAGVIIQMADGTYDYTALGNLSITHPSFENILIQGNAADASLVVIYNCTIQVTNVQSDSSNIRDLTLSGAGPTVEKYAVICNTSAVNLFGGNGVIIENFQVALSVGGGFCQAYGLTIDNCQFGIIAGNGGRIDCDSVAMTQISHAGIQIGESGCAIDAKNATIQGMGTGDANYASSFGAVVHQSSLLELTGATIGTAPGNDGFGKGIAVYNNSWAQGYNCQIYHCLVGMEASDGSWIRAGNLTPVDCATNYSPTGSTADPVTKGNRESYIWIDA